MSEIITALLGNKVVRWLLGILGALLLCFGLYKAGEAAQRAMTNAVNDATNKVIGQMQKSLQASIDSNLAVLQTSLDTKMAEINSQLKDQNNAIDENRDALNNLGDVWLRVDDTQTTPGSGSKNTSPQAGSNTSGSNAAHYAKLPAASVQFLNGEAYRADQCAVRLSTAQQVLVTREGAFEQYQQLVTTALEAAKLK